MGRHQGKVKKKKKDDREETYARTHKTHTQAQCCTTNKFPYIFSQSHLHVYSCASTHTHTCAVTRNQKTCLINLRRKCLSGTGKNNSKCTAAKRATINELVTLIPDFDFLSGCLVHNRNQQRIRTRGYTAQETVLTEDTCILRFNNTRNCSHTKRKPDYLHAYFS